MALKQLLLNIETYIDPEDKAAAEGSRLDHCGWGLELGRKQQAALVQRERVHEMERC